MKHFVLSALATLAIMPSAQAALTLIGSQDADTLAGALSRSGLNISNAQFASDGAEAGVAQGSSSLLHSGNPHLVLTTGQLSCIPGPNNLETCGTSENGSFTKLSFDFTPEYSGLLIFSYVFGSEEFAWNGSMSSAYNDSFSIKLNGIDIALLPYPYGPNGQREISVHNVKNHWAFRSNAFGQYANVQYDGLVVGLQAGAQVLAGSVNTVEFFIQDAVDVHVDSGAFIDARFDRLDAPSEIAEPSSIALAGLGLVALALRRRRSA